MGYILFAVNNLLAMAIASVAADTFFGGEDRRRKILAAVGGFAVLILFVVLALGACAKLTAGWVAAVLTVVVVFFLMLRGVRRRVCPVEIAHLSEDSATSVFYLAVALCVGVVCGIIAGRFALPGTNFNPDDLSYHGVAAVHWVVDGRLSLVPFNFHAYYPFNAETLGAWFMLAFRSDGFVVLAGFYWAGLAMVSVISFGRILGLRISTVIGGLVLVGAAVPIKRAAWSFSAVDIAAPAMVLAAVAMIIPTGRKDGNGSIAAGIYSGLFAGFAVGCKVSFAPVCVIILVWILIAGQKGRNFRDKLSVAGVFIAGVILTGSIWYIRNLIIAHNPLFPAQFGPFGGPFSADQQWRTKLISWMISDPLDFKLWYTIVGYGNWPFGIFLLVAGGYIWCGARLRRLKSQVYDKYHAIMLLFVCGVVLLAMFPFMPFSGTDSSPTAVLRTSPRFLLTAYIVGVILLLWMVDNIRWRKWIFVFAVIALLFPLRSKPGQVPFNVGIIVISVLGFYLFSKYRSAICGFTSRKFVLTTFLVGFVAALSAGWSVQQIKTDERIFSYVRERPVGSGWRALEQLKAGSTIKQFGVAGYQHYALFGRRLQLRPAVGHNYQFWHERWFADPENTRFWHGGPSKGSGGLIDDMLDSGVDYVLTTRSEEQVWPRQDKILRLSDKAREVYSDDNNRIYEMIK
ncbi:MAG: hypothetical protein FVQ79_11395 [Planctomycetes bacterium]|nr:hypothetical protein [Planctomycetota bacterium]